VIRRSGWTQNQISVFCLVRRFVASFTYYGSVLSSSELLEKNLLCVTNADREHQVKHRHEDGVCYCIPFATADYQTLLISCLGEVARESKTTKTEGFKMVLVHQFPAEQKSGSHI